jgi:phage N-6-adenine-methyltransferase
MKISQCWRTPKKIFDQLSIEYGHFDVDLFADDENHLCEMYFTETDSAFNHIWDGNCFGNPPYQRGFMDQVIDHALIYVMNTNVVLCQASTGTDWFKKAWESGCDVDFFNGRIAFIDPISGDAKRNSSIESMLLIFSPDSCNRVRLRSSKTGKVI